MQRIEADGFNGSLINIAQWNLAEDGAVFDANGSFSVKCSYKINQGARMVVDLNDHELRPARGSKIPEDVPGLVGEFKEYVCLMYTLDRNETNEYVFHPNSNRTATPCDSKRDV